uniref:Uncharacterized protein n=1 Tax=Anguilla anguilla TaxID=7936 RepID=A0A0E9P6D5_ANGAN
MCILEFVQCFPMVYVFPRLILMSIA